MKRNGWDAVLVAVALTLWIGAGCLTGKGKYDPASQTYDPEAAADMLVVTVESTRKTALNAFAALMKLEREHEAALRTINPGIHDFAEMLRRDSEKWIDALTDAKTAYQTSRSADDATALRNALAAVNSALDNAVKYLAEAAQKGTYPPPRSAEEKALKEALEAK